MKPILVLAACTLALFVGFGVLIDELGVRAGVAAVVVAVSLVVGGVAVMLIDFGGGRDQTG